MDDRSWIPKNDTQRPRARRRDATRERRRGRGVAKSRYLLCPHVSESPLEVRLRAILLEADHELEMQVLSNSETV